MKQILSLCTLKVALQKGFEQLDHDGGNRRGETERLLMIILKKEKIGSVRKVWIDTAEEQIPRNLHVQCM